MSDIAMRMASMLVVVLLLPGCATMTYTSSKPAQEVSACIADGWSKASSSGIQLPVSLTRSEDHYLVDVVLVRDFPTFTPHHSIWAKVRDSSTGSTTLYRRNFQIWHEKIDRVVVECQGGGS